MQQIDETELNAMMDKYNPYPSLRETQRKAILDVMKYYDSDAEEVIITELPVPTAGGKTLINTICQLILAEEYGEDLVLGTTPLVELMRQFSTNPNYENVPCLVGKANYPCAAFAEQGLTAADCVLRGKKKQKAFAACKNCEYRKAKARFDNSNFGNTTFDRFLYDPQIKGRTNYLFIDESASIERGLRNFSNLELPKDFDKKNPIEYLRKWLIDLEDLYNQLSFQADDLTSIIETDPSQINEYVKINKQLDALDKKMQNVRQAMYYIENDIKYLVSKEDKSVYNRSKKMYEKEEINVFKLLTAHIPFASMVKNLKMVVLSSATPATQILTTKPINVIETIHPIPKEQRPMIFDVVGSMSYNTRVETAKKMAPVIARYHQQYDSNTMVHCGSYPITYLIYDELVKYVDKENILLQVDRTGKNKYREGVLRNDCGKIFTNGERKRIWLSVEMNEGIDLAGPNYKLNLIAKLPAEPWLSDYVVTRNDYDKATFGWNQWYDTQSANKLMQSYGRICRYPGDFGVTIALDKAVYSFWRRYQKKLFYNWFNEAVVVI